MQSHTAADVVTLIRPDPHVRSDVAPLPRNRRAAHGDATDDRLGRSADGRKDDDVKFLPQVRRVANYLIRDIGVRNLEPIKLDSEPAIILRVRPGVENRNSRDCQRVSFNFGQLLNGDRLQS